MKIFERALILVLLGWICVSAAGCMFTGPHDTMYDQMWQESNENWQKTINPANPYN